MIIDVNPQTITEIAQTIANAYGEVEEAARILTSITEHNNWNCKERDAINDYTQSNAREILENQCKNPETFANVMKTVAENFTTDEQKYIRNVYQCRKYDWIHTFDPADRSRE